MSDIKTGGPAFPTTQYANSISPTGHDEGMTLRDYFAAKAMANTDWINVAASARECYEKADAMLKAREQ